MDREEFVKSRSNYLAGDVVGISPGGRYRLGIPTLTTSRGRSTLQRCDSETINIFICKVHDLE